MPSRFKEQGINNFPGLIRQRESSNSQGSSPCGSERKNDEMLRMVIKDLLELKVNALLNNYSENSDTDRMLDFIF
jgi:hypothetical protein